MAYISKTISGIPYSRLKSRGDVEAPERWTAAIVNQTKDLPCVKHACVLKVTFLLPGNKFPSDFPYGPDLDNLLKRLLDALNKTIFRDTAGHDSCVVSMMVMKTRVETVSEAGAHLEVLPVSLGGGLTSPGA
jgi:Holliday junction resolvase RusA-like endonuclease